MSLLSAKRPSAKQKAIDEVTKDTNFQKTTFDIPTDLYHAFKVKCAQENITMKEAIIKAINQYTNK